MSDTTPSAEQSPGAEQPGAAEPTNEATTPPEAPAEEPKGEGLESLPESWQREVRSLRAENAERRTKYNDLKTQLDEAKTQEDIDAAVEEYKTQVVELERSLAFERHTSGLPEEARELVTGSTDDEIKASADKVRKLLEGAGKQEPDPDLDASGGLDPRGGSSGGGGKSFRQLGREALAASGRRW